MTDPVADLRAYYDLGGEADRLDEPLGRVEFERTVEIVGAHLPASPAIVADIGGGPGRYAQWLADPVDREAVSPPRGHCSGCPNCSASARTCSPWHACRSELLHAPGGDDARGPQSTGRLWTSLSRLAWSEVWRGGWRA